MMKVYYLFMLFLSVMGFIGGIGYACYCGAYAIGIGIVALGFLAWPQVVDYFKKLTE